jgi:adenine/guanine phosphoribosyltransferase-like PRPP-binding protein
VGAVLGILAMAAAASAQITTGTVAGSIKDTQGLGVPGATVTLISEARGTRMAPAISNETGDFVIANVTTDTYMVEVTMPGFKTLRRAGVAVSGGDRVGIGDLVIEVGGTAETVKK